MDAHSLDSQLVDALTLLVKPGTWVHLGTVGISGEPHVTPVVVGWDDSALYMSVTGKQKNKNLERDPRVCISVSRPSDLAHLTIWGECQLRVGADAQRKWEWLIRSSLGEGALKQMQRELSETGTRLGVISPSRYRVYGLES